jgi:hypothetical protein
LTFDPVSKTFYSGSWNDGIIYHFDSNGIMLDSINTSFDIAGWQSPQYAPPVCSTERPGRP